MNHNFSGGEKGILLSFMFITKSAIIFFEFYSSFLSPLQAHLRSSPQKSLPLHTETGSHTVARLFCLPTVQTLFSRMPIKLIRAIVAETHNIISFFVAFRL